jgi:hypothetical protein
MSMIHVQRPSCMSRFVLHVLVHVHAA